MKIAVLCPHFPPDTAPTGEIAGRLVQELASRGHELHVISALPWYLHHRVEPEWAGRLVRTERTTWGSITRVNPLPTDKRSILRRGAAFAGFSVLAGAAGIRGGRVDAVLAMSPPLTLGLTGRLLATARRGALVFNVQDVFPDAAIELGAVTNKQVIAAARLFERMTYRASAAVTVLSDDMRDNVSGRISAERRSQIRVIPNFVDTDAIRPLDRMTSYRSELGIGAETVVMYAGNVGLSQSLDLLVGAARARQQDPSVVFVVNGGGSNLDVVKAASAGLPNIRFAPYQPKQRLAEVLATGDVHLVPLRAGLARSSVPSKMYSILAAGRPILASIDPGTEVARVITEIGAGRAVEPDNQLAFDQGLTDLLADRDAAVDMGRRGRAWAEAWVSPAAVAAMYESLFAELAARPDRTGSKQIESTPRG